MNQSTRTAAPITHTVKTLAQFLENDLMAAINSYYAGHPCQVNVCGILGEIAENSYQMYYGLQLKDESETVLLDIRKSLISAAKLAGGEYVSVVGTVKAKCDQYTRNRVEFRIDVSSIRATESPEAIEAMRRDQATISKLKSIRPDKRPFPLKNELLISIIMSRQSMVKDDFMHEIAKISRSLTVNTEFIYADMTDPADIVRSITTSRGNILAIIRGGGNTEQFETFDKLDVIAALGKHDAYRVIGLGHSGDATLADLVCDFSGNTPAQAGAHIREMVVNYGMLLEETIDATISETEAMNRGFEGFFKMVSYHWKVLLGVAVFCMVVGACLF